VRQVGNLPHLDAGVHQVKWGRSPTFPVSNNEVIQMIRIMTAAEPKLVSITVDGDLSGEYVDAVETCVKQALAQRTPTTLFLRDVTSIDERGRTLLTRLAAKGVRLRAAGVYSSYVVARISQSAA